MNWVDQVDARDSGAIFSPCRRWRYLLFRRWDPTAGVCVFIGLNPSTADETTDDPTVRRMIGYAKRWGYGSLWVLNAFAYRATDPREMKRYGASAIGPQNNEYLHQCHRQSDITLAAWGAHAGFLNRDRQVAHLLQGKELYCLGTTRSGAPRHPLYMSNDCLPTRWTLNGLARG